ncbi:transmembrane and coiled-coil domain-containing protein 6 isoform X2 [Hyla sarda]|uniref:transmembrane and coiled-coil domain-containing protein 6 isoform X2 n=1 Tax=Hyla sarda TaxID=327740 RepID=UPI0024C2C301|nr:transmembrane and coiled-coil domain-containing protein 6 isoform X2 [Hyla sarda]XP_056372692.1 transmembrane and coiled-coil domain-containing protein 6 isoform X2 [Hyla sarda]
MWRRQKFDKKLQPGLEELRIQHRERETALRKARRDQQLVSKRLLRDLTNEDEILEDDVPSPFSEQQVAQLVKDIHGSADKLKSLISLRQSLRNKDVQLMFIRAEGSMRVLIGLFTCQFSNIQMEALRCLHELSNTNDPAVWKACLPATPYLLTYLSGSSPEFLELCLYTLGNLIVESETARNQLLLQGIIPSFMLCTQSPHVAVLEATGYALSQLLQAKEAPEKIVPIVLQSGLIQDILRLLLCSSEDGFGMMIEFAWCLHYIVSSQVNNMLLISQGVLSNLMTLLIKLADLVTKTSFPGIELLLCPVVRCVGNFLTEVDSSGNKIQIQDGRLLVALFVLMQQFQKEHTFMVKECLWTLNNLTVDDPVVSSALLHLNLIPVLLQFFGHFTDIIVLVLTVLCNIANFGPAYCQRLQEKDLLSSLTLLLGSEDVLVTIRCLDLMNIFLRYCPETEKDILVHSILQIPEIHKHHPEIQQRMEAIQHYCTLMINDDNAGTSSMG